jgi:hypothetical protein
MSLPMVPPPAWPQISSRLVKIHLPPSPNLIPPQNSGAYTFTSPNPSLFRPQIHPAATTHDSAAAARLLVPNPSIQLQLVSSILLLRPVCLCSSPPGAAVDWKGLGGAPLLGWSPRLLASLCCCRLERARRRAPRRLVTSIAHLLVLPSIGEGWEKPRPSPCYDL